MGCDIHLFTEVKIDGVWHTHSIPRINRWYALFGEMAGVRCDNVEPIVQPKGLPDDMGTVTARYNEYCGSDGHTHSWFNKEEIQKLEAWLEENDKKSISVEWEYLGYVFGSGWGNAEGYTDSGWEKEGIEDVRFVFWFDN